MTQIILPRLLPRDRIIERIAATLRGLPLESAYAVEVKEHKPRRSDAQNRYLWGVVYPTILREAHLAGWSVEEVHEFCLGEWAGWETVTGLGRKRIRPIRRSSKLSKLEFMDYIADIQRRMAERGVFIPDPDPNYFAQEKAA